MGRMLKKSEVRSMMPRRSPDSHKGENGRVLIIGGSLDYFGAPILSALGALGAGADLVTLLVPECNFDVSRSFYPDFIVRKYPGNYINTRTLDSAAELLNKADCLLIGPGIGEDPESVRVIARILQKTQCQVVLDAQAIQSVLELGLPENMGVSELEARAYKYTITPHHGEMRKLAGEGFDFTEKSIQDFAQTLGLTLLLKGHQDIIASPNKELRENVTGNAGMTVGGSGDVLAGAVASLIAQKTPPYDACCAAAYLMGLTGDMLQRQKGYQFMATDLALELPYIIHHVVD